MGVSLVAYPFLAKKIPRRKIFIASLALPVLGFLLMFVISMTTKNIYYILPAVLVTVLGFGCISILSSVFLVDTVEYGEWKLGYRSENIIFSMLTLMGKFSTAFSGLLTGWGLQLAGYVSTREEVIGISEPLITQQPESVALALNILMFAVPPVILLAALALYLRKYKLHGDFLSRIEEENAAKRMAEA